MDIRCINPLVLAYLGDAIYEEYIRIYLIEEGFSKVNELQKEAIHYVSAKAQAAFLDQMIRDDLLTEEEADEIEKAAKKAVDDAVEYGENSEQPDLDSLHKDVFA